MILSNFFIVKEFNFAKFNRALNIAKHFRVIGGKKILVKGHKRSVLRIREALKDLRKAGDKVDIEYAYRSNSRTGKVSQIIKGQTNSAIPAALVKTTDDVTKVSKDILHNHNIEASLSFPDIASSKRYGGNIYAITPSGSVFRAKYIKDIPEEINDYMNLTGYLTTRGNAPKFFKENPETAFLFTHTVNKYLHDKGYIHYRSKLSDQHKEIWETKGRKFYEKLKKKFDYDLDLD